MRIKPSEKNLNREANLQKKMPQISRFVSLIMVTLSTFFFFFKLLFL